MLTRSWHQSSSCCYRSLGGVSVWWCFQSAQRCHPNGLIMFNTFMLFLAQLATSYFLLTEKRCLLMPLWTCLSFCDVVCLSVWACLGGFAMRWMYRKCSCICQITYVLSMASSVQFRYGLRHYYIHSTCFSARLVCGYK